MTKSNQKFPETEVEFKVLMEKIDKKLRREEIPMVNRPLHAIGKISEKYSVDLKVSPPNRSPKPGVYYGDDLVIRIMNWYDKRYNNNLESEFYIGKIIVEIKDDPWLMKIPLLYGKLNFIFSPLKKTFRNNDNTDTYNILDSIVNLTDELKNSLNQNDCKNIFKTFLLGWEFYTKITIIENIKLVQEALHDFDAAVFHLINRPKALGLSKWSSLQAVEKLFKAWLKETAGEFPWTHELKELVRLSKEQGLKDIPNSLIEEVSCKPGIRYGEKNISIQDALKAHNSSLKIAVIILQSFEAKY